MKKASKKKTSKKKKTYKSIVKKDAKKAKKELREIGDIIKSDWKKLTRKKNPTIWDDYEIKPNSYYIIEHKYHGREIIQDIILKSDELRSYIEIYGDKIHNIWGPYTSEHSAIVSRYGRPFKD